MSNGKQSLNIGASANDNTGDTLRVGGDKINDNFNEIYTALGNGVNLTVSLLNPSVGQVLRYNGSEFVAASYSNLTSALDVNGNSIISSSNGNIPIAANGTGDITLAAGGVTSTFGGSAGEGIDMPTTVKYKNEYTLLQHLQQHLILDISLLLMVMIIHVNINIATGGVGDVRAALLTEYSGIGALSNVDVTTTAPTTNQVLKDGTNWIPGDDVAGAGQQNLFATVTGDTGTTTNTATDTLTIAGVNITTAVSGDTVTVNFTGTLTTTFAALTDTDTTGLTQGDNIFYNGTDWVRSTGGSPMIWWELGAPVENASSDYLINGPGLPAGENRDPTLYVYRGFTYAFDNTVEGGGHPFRIQSTQGLSGTAYTTGQTGSGSTILYWTVPLDAPSTLYYQCTLHAQMQGTINVV